MSSPGAQNYLRTKVLTAGPAELRMMLLDGALRFAQQGRDGLAAKEFDAAFTGISRCQDILMELTSALNREQAPDLCQRMASLYTFMYIQLMKASSTHDPALADEVINLLKFERQTWQMLMDKLAAENRAAAGLTETPEASPQDSGSRRAADRSFTSNGDGNTSVPDSLISGSVSLKA